MNMSFWRILRKSGKIKDAITEHGGNKSIVDDMPYVIGLGMDVVLNLHEEYKAIMDMFEADNVTYPIKAFLESFLRDQEGRRHIRLH